MALLVAGAIHAAQAAAVTITWTGAVDGSWHTPGNWSLNRVPGPGDDVDIPDLAGTASVTHASGFTEVRSLDCQESLILSGGTLRTTMSGYSQKSLTFSGGVLSGGRFTIDGAFTWSGGQISADVTVYADTWSIAPVTSCILNSTLVNHGACTQTGVGTLDTSGFGRFENDELQGTYDLASNGGIIGAGDFVNRGLLRKSGGSPTSASTIACFVTNEGTIRVEDDLRLALDHLVNLAGGTTGGTLTGGDYEVLGVLSLSQGDVLVNEASLSIIGAGAHMGTRLRKLKWNRGTLRFQSNTQTLDSLLVNENLVDFTGAFVTMPAGYRQIDGETRLSNGLWTCPLVDIQGGVLKGRGTYIDGNLVNDGMVDVQPATATSIPLRATGYVQEVGGSLRIDIAGTTPRTGFDQLVVLGDVSLDGLIRIAFSGGFSPAPTDSFPFLVATGAITGAFALEDVPVSRCSTIDYDPGAVTYVPLSGCAEPPWTSQWHGAAQSLPPDTCPYALFDTASPEAPALSAGILNLSTSERTENLYYEQTTSLTTPDTLLIEARLRVVSETHLAGNPRRGVGIGFMVGPTSGNFLFVGRDTVFIWSGLAQQGATAYVDTDDAFHEYLVEVRNQSQILVYQDDFLILSGGIVTDPAFTGTPPIHWGDITLSSSAVSLWQSVKHNASATPCGNVSAVGEAPPPSAPGVAAIAMAPPFPNPSPGFVDVSFRAADAMTGTTLRIHDPAGRLVRRASVLVPKGSSTWRWDGRDDQGRAVASGMYFLRLEAAGRAVASGRVMILR